MFIRKSVIEQAKFAYSSLGRTFKKVNKNNWRKRKKQVEVVGILKPEENKEETKSVKGLFPKGVRTNENNNELSETKKWQEKTRPKDLV